MLMRPAMARAVSGWSPVTMTTLMPARCAWRTASATPRLGGSSMPKRPRNSKSLSGKLQSAVPVPSNLPPSGTSPWEMTRRAMQSTRRPCDIRSWSFPSMLAMEGASRCTAQNLRTRSGAPFMIAKNSEPPCPPWTVSIHLFSELKGISKALKFSGRAFALFTSPGPPETSLQARRMATSVGDPVTVGPSPGAELSALNSAPLFRKPQRARVAAFSLLIAGKRPVSASRRTCSRPPTKAGPGPWHGMTRSCTVISPVVSVPVLSEQKTETQPKVSTASIFRTMTFLAAIWSEAIIREMVTVGSKPSGTCANSAAALFCRMAAGGRLTGDSMFAARLSRPTPMATTAMMCTKCSIWISRVDFTREDLMLCAILPRKVLSPVAWTRHVALPFSTVVPKYARLWASAGGVVSFSVLVVLGSGTLSPVSAALSTSIPSVQ
mmetsp:Transcript_74355/g.221840  ORF Transcript_74355/g.221840 Transcript_74355/m.221840 type:complete len:436 (+) Transcript_74355:1453-2760(+)